VFYVGKGHRDTTNGYDRVRLYYQAFQRNLRQQAVWNRVRSAQSFSHRILEDNLTEPQAFSRERFWVTQFSGLVNQTGGGHSGWTLSAESRKKMSLARTGKKYGPRNKRWRKSMSDGATRRANDPIWKAAHSARLTGRKLSEETKSKISKGFRGGRPKGWTVSKNEAQHLGTSAGRVTLTHDQKKKLRNFRNYKKKPTGVTPGRL